MLNLLHLMSTRRVDIARIDQLQSNIPTSDQYIPLNVFSWVPSWGTLLANSQPRLNPLCCLHSSCLCPAPPVSLPWLGAHPTLLPKPETWLPPPAPPPITPTHASDGSLIFLPGCLEIPSLSHPRCLPLSLGQHHFSPGLK